MNLSGSSTSFSSENFSKISRRTIVEEITAQLMAMIDSQELEVDQRLPSEAELARLFDVGRPVVREALGALRALGLVVSHTGRGSFVASRRVSPTIIVGGYSTDELKEVRLHLELPVAGLAALRRSDADLERLDGMLDKFEETEDSRKRSAVDADFHMGIAQATGNNLFVRLIGDLRQQLLDQARAVSNPENFSKAALEHRAILEAIRDGNEAGAIDAARMHLNAVEARMKAYAAHPEH